MTVKVSKAFNDRVEVFESQEDVNGVLSTVKVKDIWARVMDVKYENYDVVGQSLDLFDKKVICREPNLDTNTNAFGIKGKLYQINRVETNYRQSQFTYFLNATNFET